MSSSLAQDDRVDEFHPIRAKALTLHSAATVRTAFALDVTAALSSTVA